MEGAESRSLVRLRSPSSGSDSRCGRPVNSGNGFARLCQTWIHVAHNNARRMIMTLGTLHARVVVKLDAVQLKFRLRFEMWTTHYFRYQSCLVVTDLHSCGRC